MNRKAVDHFQIYTAHGLRPFHAEGKRKATLTMILVLRRSVLE